MADAERASINDFPREVLSRILESCCPKSLGNVTRVCRRWRALCTSDTGVLKRIAAEVIDLPDRGIHQHLAKSVPSWQRAVAAALQACGAEELTTERLDGMGPRVFSSAGDRKAYEVCLGDKLARSATLRNGAGAARQLLRLRLAPIATLQTLAERLASPFFKDGRALCSLAAEHLRLGDPDSAVVCARQDATDYGMRQDESFALQLLTTGYDSHFLDIALQVVLNRDHSRHIFLDYCLEEKKPELALQLAELYGGLSSNEHERLVSFYAEETQTVEAIRLMDQHPKLVEQWSFKPVRTLLSLGLVKRAEERAEHDFAMEGAGAYPRTAGLGLLRDYYEGRNPAKSEALHRRICALIAPKDD